MEGDQHLNIITKILKILNRAPLLLDRRASYCCIIGTMLGGFLIFLIFTIGVMIKLARIN